MSLLNKWINLIHKFALKLLNVLGITELLNFSQWFVYIFYRYNYAARKISSNFFWIQSNISKYIELLKPDVIGLFVGLLKFLLIFSNHFSHIANLSISMMGLRNIYWNIFTLGPIVGGYPNN